MDMILETPDQGPVCKGQVYRCRISKYIGKRGEIVEKVTFTPAKRLSCKGCRNCLWLEQEDLLDAECSRPEDGAYYQTAVVNISRDWETGIVDGYDVALIKIEDTK